MSDTAPPANLGIGAFVGVLLGALAGVLLSAVPVGAAAGLGVGALVDWARQKQEQKT